MTSDSSRDACAGGKARPGRTGAARASPGRPALGPSSGPGSGARTSSARGPAADQPRLFLAGPTWVRPEILAAMARPVVGHRGPEFAALYRSVSERLGLYAGTSALPLLLTGSATALLEAAVRSLVRRRSLHVVCGSFVLATSLALTLRAYRSRFTQPVEAVQVAA